MMYGYMMPHLDFIGYRGRSLDLKAVDNFVVKLGF
jgi:hypothetical protein